MTLYDALASNFLWAVKEVIGELSFEESLSAIEYFRLGYTVPDSAAMIEIERTYEKLKQMVKSLQVYRGETINEITRILEEAKQEIEKRYGEI